MDATTPSDGGGSLVDRNVAGETTKVSRFNGDARLRGVEGEVKDVRSASEATLEFAGFRPKNGMTALWHLKMTIECASGSLHFERSTSDVR